MFSDFVVDVWNGEYNAEIGGILAGAAVIGGCAAIGVATLGIGGLLCAAGAGAIAGGVTSAWNGNDTDQVIHDSLVGAAWGVAGWGVGWALSRLAASAAGSAADDLLPDGSAPSGPGRSSSNNGTSTAGAGGAASSANGMRYRAWNIGREIAGNNHSYVKHVIQQGEFPGIHSRAQFAQLVGNVVERGGMRALVNRKGITTKYAWWYRGTIVIYIPGRPNASTAFRASYDYFLNKVNP